MDRGIVKGKASGPSVFVPVKASKKSEEVYDQLVRLIREGHFEHGTRLPPEREMAARFSISRQVLREALFRAELAGLIEVRHGSGSYVVSSRPREAPDTTLVDLIGKEAHRIFEFFDFRRLIEGWCAAKAATAASSAQLRRLRGTLSRLRRYELHDPEWQLADQEFHVLIAQASGNPIALHVLKLLEDTFNSYYRLKQGIPSTEDRETVLALHDRIYEALRRRDPELAKRRMLEHMDYIETKLKEAVGSV